LLATLFAPDYDRYEGVRPINVYLLRVLYFLMAAFVATSAWKALVTHEGPWDPLHAVAWSVWAAYPTLAILGLMQPLRMLPIMIFMIFYKTLWVVFVALPLYQAGTLVGSAAEEIARVFMWAPLIALIIPWNYVFHHFVMPAKRKSAAEGLPLASHDRVIPA
jgi:hypothetical protein